MPTIAVTTPPLPVDTGEVLDGRYRIVSEIADGGMGTVYLAEHVLIRRRFALKLLHRELAADTAMVKRFMNEALAAGTLGHPNIVEATDMGFTSTGVPFLVLEYIEGAMLTEEIYRVGGLPVRRALRIARQIASALACAHHASIIHLDLKSDNVFLTDKDGEQDHVKVLDFGIARFLEVDADHAQRHLIAGTPDYMAPEQITHPDRVDRRADIYALGVVLYEMLTARRPFGDGEGARTVLHRIVHDQPRPLERAQVPIELERLILKRMLAKDPARRFQTMLEVDEALTEISAGGARRPSSSPHLVTRRLTGVPALPRPPARGALGTSPPPPSGRLADGTPLPSPALAAPPPPPDPTLPLTTPTLAPLPILAPLPVDLDPTPRPAAIPAAATLPIGPRRRVLGCMIAAVAAVAAGAALLATRPPATSPGRDAARTALVAEADRLATSLEAQGRATRARAEGLAMAPVLRAAIDTDAATLQDLADSRGLMTLAPGETIEVLIARGPGLELALRLPATAPPLTDGAATLADADAAPHLRAAGRGPVVSAMVPITNQRGERAGALVVASPIDVAPIAARVARHARSASLVGLGPALTLVRDGGGGAVEPMAFPRPLDPGFAERPVALRAGLPSSPGSRPSGDAGYACFAIAGLLFLLAAVRRVDPLARIDA